MISKTAKNGDFLEGSVGAGTDDYQRITLDGNKDFGNGIAARVAVMGHHNDKAGQEMVLNMHVQVLRQVLLWSRQRHACNIKLLLPQN